MLNLILPIIGTVFSVLKSKQENIAAQAGVEGTVVAKVGAALQDYLTKDEKVWEQVSVELERARQHDIATQVKGIPVIDFLRGAVRPCITYTAMFWYVYARVYHIELVPEDYAIIGGILAFWFGMRPFEKVKH